LPGATAQILVMSFLRCDDAAAGLFQPDARVTLRRR
jgi:hypothetical protein